MTTSRSEEIHASLDHPVIDTDGHSIDFMPLLEDYIREFAGARGVERYRKDDPWFGADDEARRRQRLVRPTFGGYPADTLDHLTTIIPALLEERLGELGLDFTVIYPSPLRVGVPHMDDDDLRQPLCRALNAYQADQYRAHSARMTPAALIPMHSPTEAIEELEYAVHELGLKVVSMASYVRRGALDRDSSPTSWWDNLALDSAFDYDPVWEKCVELRVAPGFHSGTMGQASRVSYSNHIYNHIGHFANGCEPICKALFLGGVTRRFPGLKFVFLESGVAWAATLYSDLVGHWKKRNADAVSVFDPARVDYDLAAKLFTQYGGPLMLEKLDRIGELADRLTWLEEKDLPDHLDEFSAIGITSAAEIRELFTPNFFFGCEGDDPMNVLAFDEGLLPYDGKINAVYGSDIGHWDVPDMSEVLEEAYELVDDERISTDDFREFVFANPVKLHTGMNPEFFEGTAVEQSVRDELAVDAATSAMKGS